MMPSPGKPADPIARLGEVLATAEQHVQQIVAAAEHRTNDRRQGSPRPSDGKALEPSAIDALLTASEAVHHQLQRLRSLAPRDAVSDDPAGSRTDDPPADPVTPTAAATPDPPPSSTAVPVATNDPAHDHDLPIIDSSDTRRSPAGSTDLLDSARLVALSMAAAGHSSSEVETHLRNELGVTDYGPLIDYVFGISTPESVVPSWPPRRRRRGD